MTYLTPIQGEILTAIGTIAYGVFVEKWYVSRSSIIMNLISWFVILFTIDVHDWVIELMALWLFIGFLLTFTEGYGGIKQLFGSKVFGSFTLVIGLTHLGNFPISDSGLLVLWAIVSGIIFFVGKKINED